MTMKSRGPRAKVDPRAEFRRCVKDRFRWVYDPDRDSSFADPTGWWRDPEVLGSIGPELGRLAGGTDPQVVLAPQSRGTLIGSLVAAHLGVGLIELRKEPSQTSDADTWLVARTPPDYRNRNLALGIRASLLAPGTRVLFIDDWVDTGGQLLAAHAITTSAGAHWCGAAVIVDALADARLRRDLNVSSLFNLRDL